MNVRPFALLCLCGLAACSRENPKTADDSQYISQSSARADDQAMTPASYEEPAARRQADAPEQPAPVDRSAAAAPAPAANTGLTPERTPPGTQPDNTKVNERDRSDAALTPMDQGQNETDLNITQQIRQAVMADGSLSFTAKNVKIITQGGKVTLRGPVNTQQERNAIAAAARKVAGVTQVDNQLEVKSSK